MQNIFAHLSWYFIGNSWYPLQNTSLTKSIDLYFLHFYIK